MNSAAAMACQAPFTAAQWEELEQQALIFKYLMAGIPVPPELLHLLRRSSDLRFYHHAALGYCSYYGKKLDPEPGRCRRTDGKKWRCSKDAHHDSKYCERHMHRSRSRSRKPVELQSKSQSQQSSSSTMTSFMPSGINGTGSKSITGSFRNTPLKHNVAGGSTLHGSCNGEANGSQLHMNRGSYATGDEDYSYLYGERAEGDGHSFFSAASGSGKGLGMDSSSLDSSWSLMSSRASSFPESKAKGSSILQATYPQLQSVQDFEQATISSLSRPPPQQQQQQYSFFGFEFGSPNPVKLESQSLRPFFNEWPKTKDSWTDLDVGRSNRTSFSTTQLSISIPMASSDFSTTRDASPNDE